MDKGIAGGTCYNLCTTNGMEVYQFIASVLYKNIELTFEKQKWKYAPENSSTNCKSRNKSNFRKN